VHGGKPDSESAGKGSGSCVDAILRLPAKKSERSTDTDYSGYDFWLTKLNQFNGNFINADMVQAFIDSGEYRGRFGP